MSTSKSSRHHVAHAALAAAVLAVVIAPALAQQEVVAPRPAVAPRPPAIVPLPPPGRPADQPLPRPDPGNTGRPEDPAAPPPLNRDPGDLMSTNTAVYVDDSFASVDKLRKAIDFARKDQAQLAINEFQDIVSNYGQKLVLLNDNSYMSITDFVRERLLQMPAVKNGMYDQLFGTDAKRDIDAAIENRDVATLIRVCDRYYPSTAALRGLDQAAQWYFERGEFSAAAQTWRKLLTHPLVGKQLPGLLFRTSLAQHLSQSDSAAKSMRDRLQKEFPDATGTVAGKQVTLLTRLNELLAQGAWEKVDIAGDEWPAFEGGASRAALLNTHATIGARLWAVPLSDGSMPAAASGNDLRELQQRQILRANGISIGNSSIDTGAPLSSHPVLSNGTLFIHMGPQISAVSASAGTRLWTYPSTGTATDQLANISRNSGLRLAAHDSVTVYGDQVYAVMPTGATNSTTVINSGRYIADGSPYLATRLVCLNRDTGEQLWSLDKLEKQGNLTFVGSPIVTRQGIFIMARKATDQSFSQQYLVRIDRETHKDTWSCYLCSTSNPNGSYGYVAQANVPIPTLVDDVLYISTGQGADCAVDANAGRILWLRATATKADQLNTRLVPSWQYNPPVVVGDKLVTTDTTQSMRIYDRWNGRLLKTIKASDLPGNPGPYIDVLAGAVGSKVIFSVKNVSYCFEIDELLRDRKDFSDALKPVWDSSNVSDTRTSVAGAASGRPFLTAAGYYVPYTNKLVRFDLEKTGTAEVWDWPNDEKRVPGKPGNLLVTSEQVIVVNDQEVVGYSKWETARDNRMVRIKASPRDPAAYLDLAEVSFRTDHQDLAQENMKQAVDLANSGAAPAGQSVADILGRLYRTNLACAEQLLDKPESAQRDLSRFYFEQCRAAARTPEQQAEWRLRLSELSIAQAKPEEAVTLFSDVLTDSALRSAGFRDPKSGTVQSAGSTAERHIKDEVTAHGAAVYQRFEDQAAALTQRSTAAKDTAGLQQVVDGYPNASAALAAATTLAALYQDKQDWDNARRILWWLEPRVSGDAQAKAIANLVTASIGLKKFPSASAWASRGQRNYKDFSWVQAGKKTTFADLRAQIASSGGTDIDGRLPVLPIKKVDGTSKLDMDPNPLATIFARNTQLLVPLETASSLRQPNLLFTRLGRNLRIYDTAKSTDVATTIELDKDAPAVLMGATKDFAVLMQADQAIIIDLKTWKPTKLALPDVPGARPNPPQVSGRVQQLNLNQLNLNGGVMVVGGEFVINGNAADGITYIDANTGQVIVPINGSDPDALRRSTLSTTLGNSVKFSTARILNGQLVVLAGNQLQSYNIETQKASFPSITLPATPTAVVGNEDLLVVQMDAPTGRNSTFCAYDSHDGKLLKKVSLENERAAWRGLGDDGILYTISEQHVSAFDMVSQQTGVLWQRGEREQIGARFAGAAALTLDGLVVVSDTNSVLCLALDSGENRWTRDLNLNLASILRSAVEGDVIVFQSSDVQSSGGSAAFFTMPMPPDVSDPKVDTQVAWHSPPLSGPPRQSMQMADSLVVEMLTGQSGVGTIRSTQLVIRDRKGGKIHVRPNFGTQSDAPYIRSWQVIDNAIAVEVTPSANTSPIAPGTLYLWRAVP